MGHDKLRKFAENEGFACLLQPSSKELLQDGYFALRDHEIKGCWNEWMFEETQPIVLELGCGKGEYTIDLSRRIPTRNYIGVDIKGARLWKGAKYAHENELDNVAFLRTRIEFITAFFAPSEISQIWLTFSDPQMKSENSRLTSPLFLERYRKFLRPGGLIHLKTDSMFLHQYTKAVAEKNGLKILACTEDLYATPANQLFSATSQNSSSDFASQPSQSPDSAVSASPASRPAGTPASTAHHSAQPSQSPDFAVSASPASRPAGTPASTAHHSAQPSFPAGSPQLSQDEINSLYEVQTFYEKMFLEQGCKITYLCFTLDHDGPFEYPDFDAAYWRSVEGPRRSFDHK